MGQSLRIAQEKGTSKLKEFALPQFEERDVAHTRLVCSLDREDCILADVKARPRSVAEQCFFRASDNHIGLIGWIVQRDPTGLLIVSREEELVDQSKFDARKESRLNTAIESNPRTRETSHARAAWLIALALIAGLGWGPVRGGQQSQKTEPSLNGTTPKQTAENGTRRDGTGSTAQGDEPLSDAERIARLQRAITDNEKLLGDLRAKLGDPQDEYARADSEFSKLDAGFQEKKKELQKQRDARTEDSLANETELAALEPQWKLAKERFDLAIKARKTLQEQISTLEQKVRQDQEALKKLTEVKATATTETQTQLPAPVGGGGGSAPANVVGPALPAPGAAPAATPPSELTTPRAGIVAGAPDPSASPAAASTGTAQSTASAKPTVPNPQLVQARVEASLKETEAAEAEQEAKSVSERIEALRKSIELERNQLINARERADNAQGTERTIDEGLQRRWTEGAEKAELDGLRQKTADARQRFQQAREEIEVGTDRLDALQSELATLQGEEIAALRDAEEKRVEAEKAHKTVERLQNPFALQNMLRWTLDHGLRILLILVGMVLVVWLARILETRITEWIAQHGKGRGTAEDENRARTLVGVFHNAIRVLVLLGGAFMILAEVGVNILPLMGGAAVLGLAAAFGGQNLLRDYFTGFMILLESQYAVNDVVKIGEVAGLVERITLRLTVLRNMEGNVHFIPNGHIVTVTNMTHGWSRALFEIGIAYKADVDHVMNVLVELGKELRRDLNFRHMILEQPEMLGVDQFGESAVIIKFFIKTRPLMQWTVKREMLRRIKMKFDELGIEIPFPHRTVYHRHDVEGVPVAERASLVMKQAEESKI